jgi:integrase
MQQNDAKMNRRAGRLSVRQKYVYEHGYRYAIWEVSGTDGKGHRIRKRCPDETAARLWKSAKEAQLLNSERLIRHLSTHLTVEQLAAAEGLVARLGDRYTITQVGDYFFRNHQEADFKISLARASVAFRGALEGVIRERSIVQLKSTLGQFERFIGGDCNLHEIGSADCERFLRSLRTRNGVSAASRKTWNNYRADLHLFFEWCADKQRRWVATNPVADVPRMQTQNGPVEVLPVGKALALMEYVAEFKEGKLARYFALALFAGIRPGGELEKLAASPNLIDLHNQVVRISPAVSKTGKPRQIAIRDNLYQWLTRFGGDVLPVNHDRDIKHIRRKFALSHDILRHTFISMSIGAFKSFADAAIESGNSEKIIRDHYLNTSSLADAEAFWQIVPGQAERKVVHLA